MDIQILYSNYFNVGFLTRYLQINLSKKTLNVPSPENPKFSTDTITFNFVENFSIAVNDNDIREIKEDWTLEDAKRKIDHSLFGAAFGIIGLVGEMALKGLPRVVILRLKDNRTFLIAVREKDFYKLKELFE